MQSFESVVKSLENEEVKYVFGIVGKETIDFVHALSKSKIKYIVVRHEQAASFMAALYGQLTGLAGVCTATLGPGATNLMTGVGYANLDYAPVVVITGQKSLEYQHKVSHQYICLKKLFEPVTKWSYEIKEVKVIPEIVRKAFKIAQMEKPGAVHLTLPEKLPDARRENYTIPKSELPVSVPTSETIDLFVNKVNQVMKPIILVGNGVIRQDATKEVRSLAERLNIPVAHTFKSKGVLTEDDPLNFYTLGFSKDDLIVNIIREADLIITVGFDVIEQAPIDWNLDKKPILHIDTLPAEIDEYYPVMTELVGHIKQTLSLILSKSLSMKEWDDIKDRRERIEDGLGIRKDEVKDSHISLQNVIHTLNEAVPDTAFLISDVGEHKMEIAKKFQPKFPKRLIISNGFASMGVAIPGSIAAKLACPQEPVIAITGDGGFLMSFSELETARRLGLPLIIIVLNDGKLGLEKEMMLQKYPNEYGVYFSNPDFVSLANSFGLKGIRVNKLQDLNTSINSAIEKNEMLLIEIALTE